MEDRCNLKVIGSKIVLNLPKLSEAPKERNKKCSCNMNLTVGGQWLQAGVVRTSMGLAGPPVPLTGS
jgi:hypothetical protein